MNFLLAVPAILLASLPFMRNVLYWAWQWQKQEYRLDCFIDFLRTPEGKRSVLGFFHVYERFVIVTLIIILIEKSEWGYPILIGALNLEFILVLYKIFVQKIRKPSITARMMITLTIMFLLQLGLLINIIIFFPYLFPIILMLLVLTPMVFIGLSIIIIWPLSTFLRYQVIKKAMVLRSSFTETKFIGITGSYGKTSVKKFLATILAEKFKIIKTPKNINTEIGVAQFLLQKIKNGADFFIAEMGAYRRGEIRLLGEIIRQDIGILTGINEAHLGLFKNIENTISAKSEIIEQLIKRKGNFYLNFDCSHCRLVRVPKGLKVVTYGVRNHDDVDAHSQILSWKQGRIDFHFTYRDIQYDFHTSLLGQHNILNLTGVITMAFDIGLNPEEIQEGLNKLVIPEKTMHPIEYGSSILINDTYNANPDGVLAGCSSLGVFNKRLKRIIVLDDILELGGESREIHERIGRELNAFGFIKIFLIGRNYSDIVISGLVKGGFDPENIIYKTKRIMPELRKLAQKDSLILFEGRRAEKYLKRLLEN